jgi:serine/threonine protein kinase
VYSTPDSIDTATRLQTALGSKYEVRGLLGRGGFAEVYEAWDLELERQLAIKVLRPDIAWTSGMLQRFKQETRMVAKLQHANILPIHFVGEGEGLVYYAMPHLEGESLSSLLRRRGSLSPRRALDLAIPALHALQHAHEHDLVHRDIKPDNIMVDKSGRPVLMDFGIAKQLDADGGLTQTGFVVGTPYYMSPEQALGQGDLDPRSDIYSFGAVLFQMVTGIPPFDGDSSQEIVGKHLAEPPPASSDVNAAVPIWLSQIIGRCLAKKPDHRFQSAAAVADALGAGRDVPTIEPEETLGAEKSVDTNAETEVVEGLTELGEVSTRRRWRVPLVSLGLMSATVVVSASWWLTAPRLLFENALKAPVKLSLAGDQHVVEPGAQMTLRLPRQGSSGVLWTLDRPTNAEGTPLGTEIIGAIALDNPRGRTRVAAQAATHDQAYFAPLVTNDTGEPLTVTVNATTPHAEFCNCTVPPGAVRMLIGYYPLFSNSTVRVEDPSGRSAMFIDFSSEVNRRTGVVGLKFEAKDLRLIH